MKETTAAEIASMLGGRIVGRGDRVISGICPIDEQHTGALTFLSEPRYHQYLSTGEGRTVLISEQESDMPTQDQTYIIVADVHLSLLKLTLHLHTQKDKKSPHVSQLSQIDASAEIGSGVSIGHYAVVSEDARIGDHVVIEEQVSIGAGVVIGAGTVIMSGAKVLHGVVIGRDCLIHPNAVIGGEGFGFVHGEGGYTRKPHLGTVIIGDRVEIGSNTCVDRGAIRDTIIDDGVKLDNLVQIAHGVHVQEHVAIAAQAGISGSTKIGSYSRIGGQVGVIGHVEIAPGSQIQAQSGVAGDITEPGQKWYGYPSIPYWDYLRSFALFKRLPELFNRLSRVESHIETDSDRET